jgi:uncharacterized protein (TIGR02466 family)
MKILECFKTPIWSLKKPEFIKSLNKASDPYIKESKKKFKEKTKFLNDFGFSYHSTSLVGDSKFKDFHSFIGQKSWDFLDWQGFDMSKYQIFYEQSWVQEFAKNGGGHHSAHIHWNTHVNAFYFLKCSDKTSYPIFHEPRTGARATKLHMKNLLELNHATETIYFKPEPGDLIIFPGYLEHEFSVDHGEAPFRFIHICITAVLKQMAKDI